MQRRPRNHEERNDQAGNPYECLDLLCREADTDGERSDNNPTKRIRSDCGKRRQQRNRGGENQQRIGVVASGNCHFDRRQNERKADQLAGAPSEPRACCDD